MLAAGRGRRAWGRAAPLALLLLTTSCWGGDGADPGPSTSATASATSAAPTGSPSFAPADVAALFRDRPAPSDSSSRRGGRAVVAVAADTPVLDPFAVGGDTPTVRDLAPLWLPGLWRMEPDGTRSPWLAAGAPTVLPGGARVAVELRPDARWSDGSPITSADVAATWRYAATRPGPWQASYDDLLGVETPTPTRAVLVLRHPGSVLWPRLFAAPTGVLPAARLAALKGAAYDLRVTGGPFVRSGNTPGLEHVWRRTPHPWPGSDPALDEVVTRAVPDFTTAVELLAAGDVDAVAPYQSINAKARLEAAGDDVRTLTDTSGRSITVLTMDTTKAPTATLRVRQALAQAIDRPAFAEGLLRAGGTAADDLAAGRGSAFARWRRDPAAAGKLLDAAGWKPGPSGRPRTRGGEELTLVLTTPAPSDLEDVVIRGIQVQLRPVGVQVDLASADATLADRLARTGVAHLAITRWDTDRVPDLPRLLGPLAASPRGANVSRWETDEASARSVAVERGGAVGPLVALAAEQVPVLPLYVVHPVVAARGSLRPAPPVSGYGGPFAAADRWARV